MSIWTDRLFREVIVKINSINLLRTNSSKCVSETDNLSFYRVIRNVLLIVSSVVLVMVSIYGESLISNISDKEFAINIYDSIVAPMAPIIPIKF